MEEADKQKAKRIREEIKRSRTTKKTNLVIPNTEVKRLNKSYTREVKIGGNYYTKKLANTTTVYFGIKLIWKLKQAL